MQKKLFVLSAIVLGSWLTTTWNNHPKDTHIEPIKMERIRSLTREKPIIPEEVDEPEKNSTNENFCNDPQTYQNCMGFGGAPFSEPKRSDKPKKKGDTKQNFNQFITSKDSGITYYEFPNSKVFEDFEKKKNKQCKDFATQVTNNLWKAHTVPDYEVAYSKVKGPGGYQNYECSFFKSVRDLVHSIHQFDGECQNTNAIDHIFLGFPMLEFSMDSIQIKRGAFYVAMLQSLIDKVGYNCVNKMVFNTLKFYPDKLPIASALSICQGVDFDFPSGGAADFSAQRYGEIQKMCVEAKKGPETILRELYDIHYPSTQSPKAQNTTP